MRKFYGEEYSDTKRKKIGHPAIVTLGDLYQILRKAWCKETAYPSCQAEWVNTDPSYGQCAITAMLVYDMFGGSIHRIRVDGGGTHYFNKINGHYIDLKIALNAYKELEALPDESALDFCIRMGWEDYVYQMLIIDYLILNRDRHGANIEVLRNSRKKTICLASLFDHGLSLLCSCPDDAAAAAFDVMADKLCNNFIGSKSTWDNLRIIPKDKMPKLTPLHESDRRILMEGLDGVLSQMLQNKIWEMIWKRWCTYEDFCHSR